MARAMLNFLFVEVFFAFFTPSLIFTTINVELGVQYILHNVELGVQCILHNIELGDQHFVH